MSCFLKGGHIFRHQRLVGCIPWIEILLIVCYGKNDLMSVVIKCWLVTSPELTDCWQYVLGRMISHMPCPSSSNVNWLNALSRMIIDCMFLGWTIFVCVSIPRPKVSSASAGWLHALSRMIVDCMIFVGANEICLCVDTHARSFVSKCWLTACPESNVCWLYALGLMINLCLCANTHAPCRSHFGSNGEGSQAQG